MNWQRTVYHGLPVESLRFQAEPGRISSISGQNFSRKGLDQAIAIARQAGIELKIAAKIDRVDQAYFDAVIKPLLNGPGVEFVGEISHSEKSEFLGGALALLTPVQWPEPFGLVMIEAMACGTPGYRLSPRLGSRDCRKRGEWIYRSQRTRGGGGAKAVRIPQPPPLPRLF